MNARHLLVASCSLLGGCGDAPLLQDASGRYRVVSQVAHSADVAAALREAEQRHGERLLVLAHDQDLALSAAAVPDRRWRIVAVVASPDVMTSMRRDLDTVVVDDHGVTAAVDVALLWCHGIVPPRRLTVGTTVVGPGDAAGGTPSQAPGDFVIGMLRHQHRDLLTSTPKTDVVFRIGLLTTRAADRGLRDQVTAAARRYPQVTLVHRDAGGDAQRLDVLARELLAEGCRALLASAEDPASLTPIAREAQERHVALIAFDPLAMCEGATCSVGCDQETVGRATAKAIERAMPEGAAIVELGDQRIAQVRSHHDSFCETLGLRGNP